MNPARVIHAVPRFGGPLHDTEDELDFSRLRQGELIAGIGGIALIVFLFFDWFSGISGWDSFDGNLTGFIVALAGAVAIDFAALAAMGKRLNVPLPRGAITHALGSLAVLIIIWRVLSLPEGVDVEVGFFLGLAASIAISVGALLALREDGWEPLVDAGGGAGRGSGASAPAAAPRRASSAPAKSRSRSSGGSRSSRAKSTAKRKPAAKKSTAKRSSGSRSSASRKKK